MEDSKNMVNMVVETKEAATTEYKRKMTPHRDVSIRICANCGNVYIVTDNDMLYYAKTFGTIPKYCKRCRSHKNGNGQVTA